MAAPYSQDLRDRVLAAYRRGMKTKQIATLFEVCPAWARRVKQRWRETGETAPRKLGNPGIVKVDRARLAELVREHPDATLSELQQRIGLECSRSTICRALKQLGLSFKKRSSTPRNRIGRTLPHVGKHGASGCRASTPVA